MIRANTLRELQQKTTSVLDRLAGQVASGSLSPVDFMTQAQEVLSLSHSRAAILGAYRAQRDNPPIHVAIRVAAQAAESQRTFLFGFLKDIVDGRYKPRAQGGQGAEIRKRRFAMYSLRLSGTGNKAWKETLQTSDPETEGLWIRHATESCGDCLREASKGWRALSEFSIMPGEGSTSCVLRCRCSVETRKGATSYVL